MAPAHPALAALAPPDAVLISLADDGQQVALHPAEALLVAHAGDKRRRDFALGRACAHAALARLGEADAPLGRAASGAPLWPQGIVGSITHTDGYAAALVGENFAGIGIDAERVGGVTHDLWARLFSPTEQRRLESHPDPLLAATLIFCAKEAAYKAWALKGAPAFRDIEVALEGEAFVALRAGVRLGGRHAVQNGVVLVVGWIPG